MGNNALKNYRKTVRRYMRGVDATEAQLDFLIEQYGDTDCVVGIHNTYVEHENFFKVGLRNQTDLYQNSDDLSNTVYYSKMLVTLSIYPNGDGQKREQTAIILKIPKKVFTHEQGIFEKLPDGSYGIPSQYIVGAFSDGKVIENEKYEKGYNNPEAVKCSDPDYVARDNNEAIQIEAFKIEYQKYKNSIRTKIAKMLEDFKNRSKQAKLPPATEELIANGEEERTAYMEQLRKGINVDRIFSFRPQGINKVKEKNEEDKDIGHNEPER
jgi:hypothetical protein